VPPSCCPSGATTTANLTLHVGDREGQYADRWDSGLFGLAYLSAGAVRAGWTDHGVDLCADELVAVLRSEIDEYNAWATGEVYGYIVERATDASAEDWREVETCWGHIGHSWTIDVLAITHGRPAGTPAARPGRRASAVPLPGRQPPPEINPARVRRPYRDQHPGTPMDIINDDPDGAWTTPAGVG
jgi:hypothetical protein